MPRDDVARVEAELRRVSALRPCAIIDKLERLVVVALHARALCVNVNRFADELVEVAAADVEGDAARAGYGAGDGKQVRHDRGVQGIARLPISRPTEFEIAAR